LTLVFTSVITQEVTTAESEYSNMDLDKQYNVERDTIRTGGDPVYTTELNFKFGEDDKRAWKTVIDEDSDDVEAIGDCPVIPEPTPIAPVIELCDKWFKFGYEIAQQHTAIDMVKTFEGARLKDSIGTSGANWAGETWTVFNNACQNIAETNLNGLDDACPHVYGTDF